MSYRKKLKILWLCYMLFYCLNCYQFSRPNWYFLLLNFIFLLSLILEPVCETQVRPGRLKFFYNQEAGSKHGAGSFMEGPNRVLLSYSNNGSWHLFCAYSVTAIMLPWNISLIHTIIVESTFHRWGLKQVETDITKIWTFVFWNQLLLPPYTH